MEDEGWVKLQIRKIELLNERWVAVDFQHGWRIPIERGRADGLRVGEWVEVQLEGAVQSQGLREGRR